MKETLALYCEKLTLFADKLYNKLIEKEIPKDEERSSISISELTGTEALLLIDFLQFGIHSTIEHLDIENKSTRFKDALRSSLEKLSNNISVVTSINDSGDQLIVKNVEEN